MEKEVQEAFEVIKNGGVILYPTDTIWGIGCDASNTDAINKIYNIKGRSESKSLIILLDDDRNLKRYVRDVPEVAWDILDNTTKPTTIVYPGAFNLPNNLIAEDGSIAIRIVKNEFCEKLIKKLKKPLVSTSANISGEPSPKDFDSISNEILKAVDHVVHLPTFKSQSNNIASSIVKLGLNGEIDIIRK